MLNNNYICALDIGSSKIASCVVRIKGGHISSIFFESLPSKGISEGVIVGSVDLVNSIGKLMKILKKKSGINIKYVSVNIWGQDIVTKHSRAILPLAERGNKVISTLDIQRVNEQARILGSSLEEEIVHMIPFSYTIDSKSNIMNPVGLYSHKLEVDLYLICAKLSSVQSLSRAIHQSGYEIKNLMFSGLATSRAVFNKESKEGLNLFCDIGSDITELSIFKDGSLRDIEIIKLGGNDLTEKLQQELKIPFELAEDIKRSYGIIGNPEEIGEDKEILVKKSEFYNPIKQRLVSQIITSEAKSFCSRIKEAVDKKVSIYEVDNLTVVGRTVLLEGFIETLENTLTIPVKFGRIANPEILSLIKEDHTVSGQKYLTYLTALGIICQALQNKPREILPLHQPTKNLIIKTFNRLKEVYQEYF